jgi:LmbE family N-acetylglucosaminyl deacetylase
MTDPGCWNRLSCLRLALLLMLPMGLWSAAPKTSPLRVVCVGAHPDDPESACGGTLRLFVEQGAEVTVVYLTRGEAGIDGKTHEEAARIRSKEAEQGCQILGVHSEFAGQIDGATELNSDQTRQFGDLLVKLKPDVILTHWPLDTHRDHTIAGELTLRACLERLPKTSLYFYEVFTGIQSLNFQPTDYVDITKVQDVKKRATVVHRSQDGEEVYRIQEGMARSRGLEVRVAAAEAYIHLQQLSRDAGCRLLPPLARIPIE